MRIVVTRALTASLGCTICNMFKLVSYFCVHCVERSAHITTVAFGCGHSSHTANSALALLGRHAASLKEPVFVVLSL